MQIKRETMLVFVLFPMLALVGCGKSDADKKSPAAPTNNVAAASNAPPRAAARPIRYEDIGEIKLRAEQGDVQAQTQLGELLLNDWRPAEALKWYQAAAKTSTNNEVKYVIGSLLLFGRPGTPKEQTVQPDPGEGLKYIYNAATNGHKPSWRLMARVLQNGTGCPVNLVQSYAWYSCFANSGDTSERPAMNSLALKLSSNQLQEAKLLAQEMKIGQWPALETARSVKNLTPLNLQGIAFGKKPLAIINGKTVAEQDDVLITSGRTSVRMQCLKINPHSVTVQVEGENEPRELVLQ